MTNANHLLEHTQEGYWHIQKGVCIWFEEKDVVIKRYKDEYGRKVITIEQAED